MTTDDFLLFCTGIALLLFVLYRWSKRNTYSAEVPLKPGTYRIGEDLDPGKCDLYADSGSGDINILEIGSKEWNNPFRLGVDNPAACPRYRNLTLKPHDILEIDGNVRVLVTPPEPIANGEGAELTLGRYQFGVDVPPAKYDLTAIEGDGQFSFYEPESKEVNAFQDMAPDTPNKASEYLNLLCEEGSRIEVDGTLRLKLSKSAKQRGRFHKLLDFINQDP